MSDRSLPQSSWVVFSSSRTTQSESTIKDDKEKSYATSTITAVGSAPSSAKSSPAASILDAEKGESTLDDDEKLANYLVPALEKGVKNARVKPVSRWIQFRVWYNPYRIVRV